MKEALKISGSILKLLYNHSQVHYLIIHECITTGHNDHVSAAAKLAIVKWDLVLDAAMIFQG